MIPRSAAKGRKVNSRKADEVFGERGCDLHPRWAQNSSIITFDSVHEGTRQIYALDVSDF